MKLYYRYFLYPLAAVLLLLQSCIGEDNADCPPERVRVYFSYRTTYAPLVVDPEDVSCINLFVFDGEGKFVGEWIDREPQLSPSYYMELPLPYGTYRFVCWAGMEESYHITPSPFVEKQTDMEACILSLYRTPQHTVETAPNHLFHAILPQGVVDKPECDFTLDLKQLTYTIDLTVQGLEHATDAYSLSIEDNNGDYKFDASLASPNNGKLQYITSCPKDAQGQPYASLRVMALDEARPTPVLTLTNTTKAEDVFSANLIGLILKLREQGVIVDFDNIHTYHIHLTFDTDMGVDISINGWGVGNSQAEL